MTDRVYITVKLSQLLDSKTHKIAISLPELVQQTNSFSVKNRPGCAPQLLDSNPQDLYLHYNVKCNLSTSDPAGHDVRVHFDVSKVEKEQKSKDLDVRVSCSCPAFLYWGAQWNLHQRDGLEGTPRPELTAPTERLDLRSHFVICKHCKAVMERVLPSVQHNVVNLLREKEMEEIKERKKKQPEVQEREKRHKDLREKIDKIRHTKNKELQQKMIDQLRQQEEKHLEHMVELNEEEQKIQKEPDHAEQHEVERAAPATMEKQEPTQDDLDALEDIVRQEEKLYKSDRELLEEKRKKKNQPNQMKDFVEKKMTSLEEGD